MAKVMVSLPDDLLAEVDAEARRGGTTRSAVMRQFAETSAIWFERSRGVARASDRRGLAVVADHRLRPRTTISTACGQ